MTRTKFTFDTVFEADKDTASEAARARRRHTLTEVEIDKIKSDARAEGMRAGEVNAIAAVAMGAKEAAAAIANVLTQMHQERQALRDQAADVAFALARRLAHAALAAFPVADVEAALREAMHQAIGEPRITLKVAPKVAEAIGPRVAEIAHEEAYDGRIQVSADPHLTRADCRIEWRGGGAERAEAAIEQALEELIARNFRNGGDEGAVNGQ